MAAVCPKCNKAFESDALMRQHATIHGQSLKFSFRGLEFCVQAPKDGFCQCPCPLHSVATDFRDLEDMSLHLRVLKKWDEDCERLQSGFITSQLLSAPLLRSLGLAINVAHRLLVCLTCRAATFPVALRSHLSTNHKISLKEDDLQDVLTLAALFEVPANCEPPILQQPLRHPIEGLPIFSGLQCPTCFHTTVLCDKDSYDRHCRKFHPGSGSKPKAVEFAQRIRLLTSSSCVLLQPQTQQTFINCQDDSRLLQFAAAHSAHPEFVFDPNVDVRNKCPWIRQVRWDDLVAGQEVALVIASVAQPRGGEFGRLRESVVNYFQYATTLIGKMTSLQLRQIRSPTAELRAAPFSTHQLPRSVVEYALPVVGLLAMLLRGSHTELPEQVNQLIEALRASLEASHTSEVFDSLVALLPSLWHRRWPAIRPGSIADPTMKYLALSSLRHSGAFLPPASVTPIMAQFKCDMRLSLIVTVVHEAPNLEGTEEERIDKALADRIQWVRDGHESTFTSIRSTQQLAQALADRTPPLPKSWWIDTVHFLELLYEGHPIHLDKIRLMLADIEKKMQEIYEKELLLGLDLQVSYDFLHDKLASTDVGYSFVTDPRNSIFRNNTLLLSAILKEPSLRERFIALELGDGQVEYNIPEIKKWLSSYRRFHTLLLLRCYLTGGAPARGTEMTAMLLRNTPEYPLRNLVAYGKHIAILCTYSKTSAMLGHDKLIPHALDGFTADILVQELAIARPFAMLISQHAYPRQPEVHQLLTKHIFVNGTRLFTTDDLSDQLKVFTLTHVDAPIGVQAWRQVHTVFRRKHCSRAQEILIDEDDNELATSSLSVGPAQMGHNRKTETKIYGITQHALQGAPEDTLPLFMRASEEWQQVCGVVPGALGLSYRDAIMSKFVEHRSKGRLPKAVTEDEVDSGMLLILRHMDDKFTALDSKLDTQFDKINRRFKELEDLILGNSVSRRVIEQKPPQSPLPTPTRPGLAQQALQCMRHLLGRPDANWKSSFQEKLVVGALLADNDMVAILPTNIGKTMAIAIPPMMEKGTEKITVVVVPLAALMTDLCRRLDEFRVEYEVFQHDESTISGRNNLVLVSADKVSWSSWQQAIAKIANTHKLTRTIVDEAHINLLHKFRQALNNASDIRCTTPHALILMSATVTPRMVEPLKNHFHIVANATILRAPSDRDNLVYDIQRVGDVHEMPKLINLAISDFVQGRGARAIIFVPSKSYGNTLSAALKIPFYNADETSERRTQHFNSWREGQPPVIIATVGFGTGIDYPHIRLVVHAGVPIEMLSYVQECARAGRDGELAHCVMLAEHSPIPPLVRDSNDYGGFNNMRDLVRTDDLCIRCAITLFCDGTIAIPCKNDALTIGCGRCTPRISAKRPYEATFSEPVGRDNGNAYPTNLEEATATALEKRKRQRLDRISYDMDLAEQLRKFKGRCPICAVLRPSNPDNQHNITRCPHTQDHPIGDVVHLNFKSFMGWRRGLHYESRPSRGVCFFCHVPYSLGEDVHPSYVSGLKASDCPTRDIVAPLVYAVLSVGDLEEELRKQYPTLPVISGNPSLASHWLTNDQTIPGHATNLIAAFYWYAKKVE